MNPENALNAVIVLIAGIMFGGMTYSLGIANDAPLWAVLLLLAISTYGTVWGMVYVARD